MTTTLDPRISEFETTEQETQHTEWIRGELERRRADPRPPVPHDEVVRRMEARFVLWQQRQKAA
jgi:hypothetical protein